MARFARVIAVDTPHHITQRGNARRFVLQSDSDRRVYLQLLQHSCRLHKLDVAGYCLMSNHVHLVTIPRRPESLALALKHAHARYAAYFNASTSSSGHVWQGRYYSCPLDAEHFWAALRYTEQNPVRAGICVAAEPYPWSSATAHCGLADERGWLALDPWLEVWTSRQWREYLTAPSREEEAEQIRRNTHSGRPLGGAEFIRRLEGTLHRCLSPRRSGRPPKERVNAGQQASIVGQAG